MTNMAQSTPRLWRNLGRVLLLRTEGHPLDLGAWVVFPGWTSEAAVFIPKNQLEEIWDDLKTDTYIFANITIGVPTPRELGFRMESPAVAPEPDKDDGL